MEAKERKFTIEEIKRYLMNIDSLGDALYYLSAERIDEANLPKEEEEEEEEN